MPCRPLLARSVPDHHCERSPPSPSSWPLPTRKRSPTSWRCCQVDREEAIRVVDACHMDETMALERFLSGNGLSSWSEVSKKKKPVVCAPSQSSQPPPRDRDRRNDRRDRHHHSHHQPHHHSDSNAVRQHQKSASSGPGPRHPRSRDANSRKRYGNGPHNTHHQSSSITRITTVIMQIVVIPVPTITSRLRLPMSLALRQQQKRRPPSHKDPSCLHRTFNSPTASPPPPLTKISPGARTSTQEILYHNISQYLKCLSTESS